MTSTAIFESTFSLLLHLLHPLDNVDTVTVVQHADSFAGLDTSPTSFWLYPPPLPTARSAAYTVTLYLSCESVAPDEAKARVGLVIRLTLGRMVFLFT